MSIMEDEYPPHITLNIPRVFEPLDEDVEMAKDCLEELCKQLQIGRASCRERVCLAV